MPPVLGEALALTPANVYSARGTSFSASVASKNVSRSRGASSSSRPVGVGRTEE